MTEEEINSLSEDEFIENLLKLSEDEQLKIFEKFPELKSLIEENSGKTVSSVSKKLNYLIIGDKPTKKKIDNAKQLKINVIDQAEFMIMLNKTS